MLAAAARAGLRRLGQWAVTLLQRGEAFVPALARIDIENHDAGDRPADHTEVEPSSSKPLLHFVGRSSSCLIRSPRGQSWCFVALLERDDRPPTLQTLQSFG